MKREQEKIDYDVVIIGGAFSGSAFATLLKRWRPSAKVLIVERAEVFDRKVGEATVEVSAYMLHRVLGLYDLLAREHLPKHGLRYWFSDRPDRPLSEMAEVGHTGSPSLPTFQLDRSKLDESLLTEAVREGTELVRPAKVNQVELGWPSSALTYDDGSGPKTVKARWIVDASGRQAFLARRMGILERNEDHPTAAVWGRWSGVKDFDGPEIMGKDPRSPRLPNLAASRRLATNHFCGYGWWAWMIPLAGGETSVGLVYDKRFFSWPDSGSAEERYRSFLLGQAGISELLDGASLDQDDFRSYAHLPYCSKQYMEPGWALVGDAASFIDPFYSPGLDHASVSAYATARLILKDLSGELSVESLSREVEDHNEVFLRSYRQWFGALYQDKYETFGDAELTAAGFMMDTALYYSGVVSPIHRDVESMGNPLFGAPLPHANIAYRMIRFYNQRLVKLARRRRQAGRYGQRNANWRWLKKGPRGGRTGSLGMLWSGARIWLKAEAAALFLPRSPKRKDWEGKPATERVKAATASTTSPTST